MRQIHIAFFAVFLLLVSAAFSQTETNRFSRDGINEAEKLIGLEFSESKMDMMLPGLREQLRDFQAMRKFALSNSVPPAILFNPIPVGMKFERERKKFRMSRPGKVRLPDDLNELAFYSIAQLAELIAQRLRVIGDAARRVEEDARGLPDGYARRIKERVALLLDGGRVLDDSRLAQEVALLAGRVDITEELVRMKGYLAEAENTLARPQGPIGKTLDFILQEMNREANTISSKAEALPICQAAIVIKAEVEKIREQVQNLE